MILNMNQLRAFYTAAKLGSVSKAAEKLMVTPPAITMQVKQLEATVRIRLLVREGNSIRLTQIGGQVFEKAKAVFQEIHEMEGFLEDISSGKSGELRIGCPETPARYLMPKLVAEFKESHPDIRIIIDQGRNAEMVKSIEDYRNELAIIQYRPNNSRLKVKVIRAEEVVLIASPTSSHIRSGEISATQLSEAPLILQREGSAVREVVLEYLRKFRVTPLIAMESSSVALLKEFVQQDNGVGFVERDAIREELNTGSLKIVRILEGSPVIEFGIGYRNRRNLSPAAWAFLRLLDKSEAITPFER
jgi:DNA-binding transcriptional LysR family regulator